MERQSYRVLGGAQTLAQDFPQGSSADNVTVTVYNIDAGTTDVSSVAMTYATGSLWKYAGWTPTLSNYFRVDYYNATLDVHFFEYVSFAANITSTPSVGLGTTALSTYRVRLLKLLDMYNANDLTGTNSAGEIADICINEALQTVYSILKNSLFLESYASTALISVASQAYINLSAITDMDVITGIKDTTNNITLIEISKERYFREVPNPSQSTGTPFRFCRIFNRIYLDPMPNSAITYTTEYLKTYPRLVNDSDTALLPTKYDTWIIKEAKVEWYQMEDKDNVPALAISERDFCRDTFVADALSGKNNTMQSMSFFRNKHRPRVNPYDHPF